MTAMVPAHAGPTTLLGVYEEIGVASCSNTVSCGVSFTKVTAPLKVTNVSCTIRFADPNKAIVIQNLALSLNNTTYGSGIQPVTYLGPIGPMLYGSPGYSYYNLSQSVLYVFPIWMVPFVQEIGRAHV